MTADDDASSSMPTEALVRGAGSLSGCRLVVVEGPDAGVSHDLPSGSAVIGKSASCDVRLRDPSVSGTHLRVEVREGGLHVTDLGSTNGTLYLGTALEQAVLTYGAVLTLGRTRLALASREPPASAGYSPRPSYGALVGSAPAMRRLYAMLERLEATEYTVLIDGETGSGKELVAREIHRHSPRHRGPYEIFDCSAVAASLVESELFGHVKGAFTGAVSGRDGVFTRAHGGTVFLDEIGELPLALQPKLLRVLESRELRPVGGEQVRPVNVRVVAATHRDLADEVRKGSFREDLFFRLNVVTVRVPPLRERREDIPALVRHFLESMNAADIDVSASTVELFTSSYDWPGNVRELRNAIARVASLGSLPDTIRRAMPSEGSSSAVDIDPNEPFDQAKRRLVDAFERDYLQSQLERSGRNLAKAARQSGMDRSYFKRLLRRHGLLPRGGDE